MKQSAALLDSLMAEEISSEERRLLELASDLRDRGLKSESCNAYWDVLALNPRNETAQAALRRMKAEVTVTGIVPPPIDNAQLDSLEDLSDSMELIESVEVDPGSRTPVEPDSVRRAAVPRHRSERVRIPSRARPLSHAPRPAPEAPRGSPAVEPRPEQDVLAALTGDIGPTADNASRIRSRVSLAVLMLAVIGLLAMVWDTRRELSILSTELRAQRTSPAPAAAKQAPQTVELTFKAATSVEYEAPISGVVTTRARPGDLLQPGDLVAEIMTARAYRRLAKARARYRWLKRKARRAPRFRTRAEQARADAVRAWRRGRKSHVRAVQAGIARPVGELGPIEAGGTLMQLEAPALLSAELPQSDGLDVDATCRFTKEAADAACRLVFERGAGRDRVRVMLPNPDGRFLPGQSFDVIIEPGASPAGGPELSSR